MTTPTITDVEAHFRQLKDRTWGVAVESSEDLIGHMLDVPTTSGNKKPRMVLLTKLEYPARYKRGKKLPAVYRCEYVDRATRYAARAAAKTARLPLRSTVAEIRAIKNANPDRPDAAAHESLPPLTKEDL